MTRRDYLLKTGLGFGGLALSDLLAAQEGPLAPKPPHESGRAKAVIQLFMHGGASHVDTFDYKPELEKRSGETLSLELAKTIKTSFIHDPTKAILRGSGWEFKPSGQSGLMISDLYQHVREHADDLAVIKSCYSNQFDHAPAIYLMNTGSRFPGRPCLGSWVTYGLGTENQNLPSLITTNAGRF